MTEKEKMIKVIKKAFEDCGRMLKEQIPRVLSGEIKKASDGTPPLDEAIADALIEAGIGDISKWQLMSKVLQNQIIENSREEKHRTEEAEHRAEVAEKALLTACVNLIKDEEDVNMELLAHVVYTKFLRKAEKELEEEKKNEI